MAQAAASATESINTADREKRAAATSSVIAAVFLTGMKLVVGLATGSLGILAEAAHSGLDLVAAVVTLMAVRISGRPPSPEYTYGHGKVENLSALVETVLLIATCTWIVYEAIRRLTRHDVEIDPSVWAFLVMGISIVVDVSRSRMLYRTARKHDSQALEADALHFSTDIWSSAVVILGLAMVWLGQNVVPRHTAQLAKADAVAALGVACIVLFVSYELGRRTIEVLLDRAPSGLPRDIANAVRQLDGVLGVDRVRVRRSGPGVFVDLNVSVDRNQSFEGTHAIAEAVEDRVRTIAAGADVVVHTDPLERERENTAQRVRAVAGRSGLAVHNISIHGIQGELHVDLHLEVDDHLSLRQAHQLASGLEQALRADMGEVADVRTHIESRGTGIGNGADVTANEAATVQRVVAIANGLAGDGAGHDVIVRRCGDGLAVSLHCHFDEDLPISEVHDRSSAIEDRILAAMPGLKRVLVHAEPDAG